jgi:MFS family permease
MAAMSGAKNSLAYYGWFVLAASALCEMLAQGATSYGAGLFVLPLQAEYHLSRANASSAIIILFVGVAVLAPWAGRLLDRMPIRASVTMGAIFFSLGLAAIAMTNSLTVMVLALLLPTALGFALLGPMNTSTLATRWFFRHRGLALGIAAVATSGGGFVVVPLLSVAIQRYGWRQALLVEAIVFFAVVTALALLVLKDNPYRAGLGDHPENQGREDQGQFLGANAETAPEKLSWRRILSRRGFWAPSLMMASVSALAQVIVVSIPAYGHALGFTTAAAASLISVFSIMAAATKIFFGIAADYWDKRLLLFLSGLFMPLALLVLCLFATYPAMLAACAMAGVALGGALPLSYGLIAARFGAAHFGAVIGWSYMLLLLFLIVTVRFAGLMFDRSGGYLLAFEGMLAGMVILYGISLLSDLRPEAAR